MSSEKVPFNNPQITSHENALARPVIVELELGNTERYNTIYKRFSLKFLIVSNIISSLIGFGFHYLLMDHSILEQHGEGPPPGGNCVSPHCKIYTATDQAACLEADDSWCAEFKLILF